MELFFTVWEKPRGSGKSVVFHSKEPHVLHVPGSVGHVPLLPVVSVCHCACFQCACVGGGGGGKKKVRLGLRMVQRSLV